MLLSLIAAATSPNGAISLDIAGDSCIVFSYSYSAFGNKVPLLTLDADVVETIGTPARTTIAYTMPTGKRQVCANACEEQLYRLAGGDTLAVRLYNDGFAWRRSRPSTIIMAPFLNRWTSRWTDSYENFFPHNATLPFTRNIVGPMDYTPCAFSDSQPTRTARELPLGNIRRRRPLADNPHSLSSARHYFHAPARRHGDCYTPLKKELTANKSSI